MLEKLLTWLSALIISVISAMGYGGVILLMAAESACIPLPSEVIMPFAGYLVSTGRFGLQAVAIAGAVGCLLGSYVAYFVGAIGGRRAFERYGRFVLISPHELEVVDHFFARWGSTTVFAARLLPVVRTFIAFPGWSIAHGTVALQRLHLARLLSVVPGIGVGRNETGPALARPGALFSSL